VLQLLNQFITQRAILTNVSILFLGFKKKNQYHIIHLQLNVTSCISCTRSFVFLKSIYLFLTFIMFLYEITL